MQINRDTIRIYPGNELMTHGGILDFTGQYHYSTSLIEDKESQ